MNKILKFPDKLHKGDTIGLVAPSFPVSPEEFGRCKDIVKMLGYQLIAGECITNNYNIHGYLAGDGKTRAKDLNNMFANPEIKAIFCARGGYGSSHILPYLDLEVIKKNPKIFVGYSDITNIHTVLQQFCDLVTFYGPMVCSNMLVDFDEYSYKSLFSTINWDRENILKFLNPSNIDYKVINEGIAKGIIIGGNLSLITRCCGSSFQLDAADKILFFEDINESIALLDMYITQMEYSGIFKDVKGLLFGDFTECNNESERKLCKEYWKLATYLPGWNISMPPADHSWKLFLDGLMTVISYF